MRNKIKKKGLQILSALAGSRRAPLHGKPQSFLVIRRNRMGDMLCTLPLLHALRRGYPEARITVACEPEGEPIAQACPAVDEVFLLRRGLKLHQNIRTARQLQGHDAVIAVKVGFDARLASLTRMTQCAIRIGFERIVPSKSSFYYTHVVQPSATPEHQIESCLRLLRPLGIERPPVDLSLTLPETARDFAVHELQKRKIDHHAFFAVINLSSTQPVKWPRKNFIRLAWRLAHECSALVALASTPVDREETVRLARHIGSPSVFVPETSTVLELGALIEHTAFIFTPEGGVGHLAAALNRPAIIFWSGGPFLKWNTRAPGHYNIRADLAKKPVSVDEVWEILLNDYLPKANQHLSSYDAMD